VTTSNRTAADPFDDDDRTRDGLISGERARPIERFSAFNSTS
jgi:hypothetical protein